jgi:hypothetical protein
MHESLKFFIIFFKKINMGIFKFFINENSNEWLKLKDKYSKLTPFKVWVPFYKIDKKNQELQAKLSLFKPNAVAESDWTTSDWKWTLEYHACTYNQVLRQSFPNHWSGSMVSATLTLWKRHQSGILIQIICMQGVCYEVVNCLHSFRTAMWWGYLSNSGSLKKIVKLAVGLKICKTKKDSLGVGRWRLLQWLSRRGFNEEKW